MGSTLSPLILNHYFLIILSSHLTLDLPSEFDVCLSVHRCIRVEKKTNYMLLNVFISLIICSTCFGHLYAHHQELETILVLLPQMVCNALVAGGRLLGAEQQALCLG